MGNAHSHREHEHRSSENLKTAFLLNLTFTVIEIIGGFWTNSIAILSDAVHDLGDSISLGLAWHFDRVSRRGRTSQNTYGYRRYSLLGALITALVLLAGITFVLVSAVSRLFSPEAVNAPGMMVLAVIGVAFNGMAVLKVRRGSSLTEQVVSWHLLEDTLGWIAVLIGAAIMTVWDIPVIDPILSIGISLFVLWNVVRNLGKVFNVFIQKVPQAFDVEAFEQSVLAHPKILSMHHTHSWTVDGEIHVLTTHLVMSSKASRDEMVAAKAHVRQLLDPSAFAHLTVEVELDGELCLIGQPAKYGGKTI